MRINLIYPNLNSVTIETELIEPWDLNICALHVCASKSLTSIVSWLIDDLLVDSKIKIFCIENFWSEFVHVHPNPAWVITSGLLCWNSSPIVSCVYQFWGVPLWHSSPTCGDILQKRWKIFPWCILSLFGYIIFMGSSSGTHLGGLWGIEGGGDFV